MTQDDQLARRAHELLAQRRQKEVAERQDRALREANFNTYLEELQPQIRKLLKEMKVAPNGSVSGLFGLTLPLWEILVTYQNDVADSQRPITICLFARRNGIWTKKMDYTPALTDGIRQQISEGIAQFASTNAGEVSR